MKSEYLCLLRFISTGRYPFHVSGQWTRALISKAQCPTGWLGEVCNNDLRNIILTHSKLNCTKLKLKTYLYSKFLPKHIAFIYVLCIKIHKIKLCPKNISKTQNQNNIYICNHSPRPQKEASFILLILEYWFTQDVKQSRVM